MLFVNAPGDYMRAKFKVSSFSRSRDIEDVLVF